MVVVVAVSSIAVYELYYGVPSAPCRPVKAGNPLRTHLSETTFGPVSEYGLPSTGRWPNAMASASDGSVWFAEQGVPGVAHFFPGNGTLVEYAWPGYPAAKPPQCAPTVSVSGMAIWDGRIWAADEFDNRTIGLDPSTGSVLSVNSTGGAPFPYWLAVGPDGNLWFTSNNFAGQPTRLGRILPNMTLQAVDLVGLGNNQPIQLDFVNSTFAILATLNQADNRTTHACICTGNIYSFNPTVFKGAIVPTLVGGGYLLRLPTSLAFSNGSIWVTEHASSSVVRYDYSTRAWTRYPTSTVPWIDITLPYVIQAEGGNLWFNEHYASKIAVLNPREGTLTEFSESNPPIADPAAIQNDLSIAVGASGVWFTSMTGNYVGFVNSSFTLGFGIRVSGDRAAQVAPGGSASFNLTVSGQPEGVGTKPMTVNYSDSENFRSIPQSIRITPSHATIPQDVTAFNLEVTVSVGSNVKPGDYTVAITVTNGDVQQSAYLFVVVT